MDYPLLLGGEERGILKLERQGLYTLIEAAAPGAEGLVRLWVQGGGEETYLGVMEPRSGGLYLRRKLSRLEMSGFPEKIERASDSRLEEVYIIKEQATEKDGGEPCPGEEFGEGIEKEAPAGRGEKQPEEDGTPPGLYRGREEEAPGGRGEKQPEEDGTPPGLYRGREEEAPGGRGEKQPGENGAGQPPEDRMREEAQLSLNKALEAQEELLWTARRDGSLIARVGEHYLVALPARLRSLPPGARLRRIGGREYLLFVY